MGAPHPGERCEDMGFFDNLRDKLSGNDEYYDDDYEDDGYDEEGDDYDDDGDAAADEPSEHSGLLGNTSRPEAESVSVYTRSGRPVAQGAASRRSSASPRTTTATPRTGGQATPLTSVPRPAAVPDPARQTTSREAYAQRYQTQVPAQAQLPPYVLRPVSYDDVQTVVRRARTNQPVVLVLQSTGMDTAKRIIDFCLGLSCGLGGSVEELGERVFVVLPEGRELSDADIDKLVADGDLQRS